MSHPHLRTRDRRLAAPQHAGAAFALLAIGCALSGLLATEITPPQHVARDAGSDRSLEISAGVEAIAPSLSLGPSERADLHPGATVGHLGFADSTPQAHGLTLLIAYLLLVNWQSARWNNVGNRGPPSADRYSHPDELL